MGRYQVRSIASLYLDDIRSIQALNHGERLLSTCPVSTASASHVAAQFGDAHYLASLNAHVAAAKRGVFVTRIYLFKSRDYLDYPAVAAHLTHLSTTKLDARLIFRDETRIEGPFDFLVFGKRKVSVGVVDPDTGTVNSAIVYADQDTIRFYEREYEKLRILSASVKDVGPPT